MIRHPSGYFEIRENSHSRLTMDLSYGNIDFSYSDNDGSHACFTVDPGDLRKAIDALCPEQEQEMKARVRERVDLGRVMRFLHDHLAEYREQGMAGKAEALERILGLVREPGDGQVSKC